MSRRNAPVIPSVTSHSHHGPRLRPGPVRSRDDAIHRLGNIPVLTPHQVIHTSAGLEARSTRPHQADIEDERDARSPEPSHSEADSQVSEQSTPSPVRGLQLPFRPALTAASGSIRLAARDNNDPGGSSPNKHSPHAYNISQVGANTSGLRSEGAVETQLHTSTDGSTGDGTAQDDDAAAAARLRSLRRRRGLASPGEGPAQAVSASAQYSSRSSSQVESFWETLSLTPRHRYFYRVISHLQIGIPSASRTCHTPNLDSGSAVLFLEAEPCLPPAIHLVPQLNRCSTDLAPYNLTMCSGLPPLQNLESMILKWQQAS